MTIFRSPHGSFAGAFAVATRPRPQGLSSARETTSERSWARVLVVESIGSENRTNFQISNDVYLKLYVRHKRYFASFLHGRFFANKN